MRRRQNIAFGILILAIIILGLWEYRWDLTMLEQEIRSHPFLGAALYVVLVITSIVVLPLSSLPLLPVAARIFGVWMTAILSIIGWWLGCLIAFQIARFGRKYLEKFASLSAVDRLEQKIPKDIGFAGIVILRMILPVDVTSFALGLLRHLSFSTYAIASLIGIIPFAFVWSYAGGELGRGQFLTSTFILIGMTFAVLLIRRLWQRSRQ
ncbi:TVP38/TMEM64 family protein [Candidatus Peregrinibacteria bacterium]|nr:TVP38/TMEM64 family protein [Candidatus Peregrinibacteria bacterium]MBI3816015.1 TVP38/TMEM64 family protein [Candidatus Peregrinibacteria bacterium]